MLLCHIQIRTFEYKTFRMKSIYLKRSHQVLLTSHPTNPQLPTECIAKYLEIRATTYVIFLVIHCTIRGTATTSTELYIGSCCVPVYVEFVVSCVAYEY